MLARRITFDILVLLVAVPLAIGQEPDKATNGEQHWAFTPVRRPAAPTVHLPSWVRTPIDAFILAKLEGKGLRPAAPADRRTLLRRVYLDLIGLPPTPAEQEAFLRDSAPDAYVRVVDDLLSRPEYGERWARHWLDVVRYAETNGYERDGAKPQVWRYRDYVINAFNKDKPYSRFITEQLAGDEIDGSNAETQIALTFLRLGTWDDEPAEPKVDRYDQLDDVLGTTATAFLGLTLRCARCHDHKFEPYSQMDYYRMLAVFEPLKRPQAGRTDLDRPVGTEPEVAAHRDAVTYLDKRLADARKGVEALKKPIEQRLFAEKKCQLPAETVTAFQTEASKRTPGQQKLVKKHTEQLNKEVLAFATPLERKIIDEFEKRVAQYEASKDTGFPRAYIWYEDSSTAPVTHVFGRGDPNRPKKEASPGLPTVLIEKQPAPPNPTAKSTGRRLWLARWLTRTDNPLTARVMVNRVWQWHFGKGLVASANDFGTAGEKPSHPELLDWLAAEFMTNGWKLKPLHRMIVLSNAYQQSSSAEPQVIKADPKNQWLSRYPQRRLDAEVVRDSILAVSGQLNSQRGGPSIYPTLPRAVLEGQSRPGDGWGKSDERQASRRSIYVFVKRSLAVPELELLDAPDNTSSCECRQVSTTGPQALTFLNGEFTHTQARFFAERLIREAGSEPRAQIERGFLLTVGRLHRPEELRASLDFLTKQRQQIETDRRQTRPTTFDAAKNALEAWCLVALNMNEFVYQN